jgi:hypothetical protein
VRWLGIAFFFFPEGVMPNKESGNKFPHSKSARKMLLIGIVYPIRRGPEIRVGSLLSPALIDAMGRRSIIG